MSADPSSKVKPGAGSTEQAVLAAVSALACRPGVRTSEFWLLLAAVASAIALAFAGRMSAEWATVVSTVAGLLFQILRQRLKAEHRSAALDLAQILLDQIDRKAAAPADPAVITPPVRE